MKNLFFLLLASLFISCQGIQENLQAENQTLQLTEDNFEEFIRIHFPSSQQITSKRSSDSECDLDTESKNCFESSVPLPLTIPASELFGCSECSITVLANWAACRTEEGIELHLREDQFEILTDNCDEEWTEFEFECIFNRAVEAFRLAILRILIPITVPGEESCDGRLVFSSYYTKMQCTSYCPEMTKERLGFVRIVPCDSDACCKLKTTWCRKDGVVRQTSGTESTTIGFCDPSGECNKPVFPYGFEFDTSCKLREVCEIN